MIEIEKTYLAKYLPLGLEECEHFEITDIYFPGTNVHPKLRLRKKGNTCTMTKKSVPNRENPSVQIEDNISLTIEEYDALSKVVAVQAAGQLTVGDRNFPRFC